MSAKPNILFINTDQHTYDAISAHGSPHVDTPNINRLHENGVSFLRSYTTDPVCAPARSSWATGLYTSENGVPFNGGYLHEHIPDIGQLLTAGGYNAYHCGKWHVDGRDVTTSFRTIYYGASNIGAGGAEYHDSVSTHAVLDLLSSYDAEKPFYLQIGYINPHDICEYEHNFEEKAIPDPVEQGMLRETDLPPLPDNFEFDEREVLHLKVARRDKSCAFHWPIMSKAIHWSENQWRYLRWNEYRFIEKVDQEIGMVLDAISASSFRDNTLIIFSVDHGEAYGQHKLFQKFALYEESVRVPFIVSCLGSGVKTPKGTFDSEHLLSGNDIFATICDYAGIRPPVGTHGRSVRPIVEGENVEWRDFAYIESNYWGRSLVSQKYKYITEYKPKDTEDYLSPGPDSAELGNEQLFDLEADPGETKNLAYDSQMLPILSEFRRQLAEYEGNLKRTPADMGGARHVIDRFGDKLRQRWRAEKSH